MDIETSGVFNEGIAFEYKLDPLQFIKYKNNPCTDHFISLSLVSHDHHHDKRSKHTH